MKVVQEESSPAFLNYVQMHSLAIAFSLLFVIKT